VMAVFGAPLPQDDHADRALRAAAAMHERQADLDAVWAQRALSPFGLGIGLSTGDVAAALLGSEERLEYTVVGDTVNLSQRLQDLARPAGTTIASLATITALHGSAPDSESIEVHVKGREGAVQAVRFAPLSTTFTGEQP